MNNLIIVFYAGTQVGKFRFLLYFSLVCLVGSMVAFYWIAFDIEDVELINQERWLLALIVLALGVAFFGGMLIYSHRYVVWLWVDEQLRVVDIETMALFGGRVQRFSVEELALIKYDAGELRTYYHHIRTPYLKLRVSGQRLPYVVDLQGYIPEEALFGKLVAKLVAKSKRSISS